MVDPTKKQRRDDRDSLVDDTGDTAEGVVGESSGGLSDMRATKKKKASTAFTATQSTPKEPSQKASAPTPMTASPNVPPPVQKKFSALPVYDIPYDAPKWVKQGVDMLNTDAMGQSWVCLVLAWFEREEKGGFSKGSLMPNSNLCPSCVAQWQKRHRSASFRPTSSDLANIDSTFWGWWCSLQPAWRIVEGSTRPVKGASASGWAALSILGPNSFLQILAVLFFWGSNLIEKGDNVEDNKGWFDAVDDVRWVLERLKLFDNKNAL